VTQFRLRRRRAIVLALSAGVLGVAPASAGATVVEQWQPGDTGAPAAVPPPPSQVAAGASEAYQDIRSPDARAAAQASQQRAQSEVAYRDLRSPDARDAALASTTGSQPAPAATPVETRTVIAVEESGSNTLPIVFSAIALVIALLAVGFVAVARRPRPRWTAP
jgi:hypothetical protein